MPNLIRDNTKLGVSWLNRTNVIVKQILKKFGLVVLALCLGTSCLTVSLAQTKQQKSKKSVAAQQQKTKPSVAVKSTSDEDCDDCIVSFNSPRPDVNRADARTSQGYLISDCEPMTLYTTFKPKLAYPPAAKAVRASGLVSVDVVIDEDGKVVWAKVLEGHPLLHTAALRADCQTRFKPVVDCTGRRLKTNTISYYNFKIDK
jgi:TonB family protein